MLQSRPITTLGGGPSPARRRGDGAAGARPRGGPGIAYGRVRILAGSAEGGELQRGEILVAPMTTPDWVPTMRGAGGDGHRRRGMTCHAAIVARELGVPCVVGRGGDDGAARRRDWSRSTGRGTVTRVRIRSGRGRDRGRQSAVPGARGRR